MSQEIESERPLEADEVEFPPATAEIPETTIPVVPADDPAVKPAPKLSDVEMDWTWLKSKVFWFIGASSIATVLADPNFADMPWNQILAKIVQLWGAGAGVVGFANRNIDALKK